MKQEKQDQHDGDGGSGGGKEHAAPLSVNAHLLVAAVFADLLAVALVVPLLPIRFKQLGVTPAMYGVVGSAYSAAQIVGGVLLGVASDAILGRRGTLLLSMAGACAAYALVAVATDLRTLVASRVLVGLVKQTMTASTAIMADLTAPGGQRTLGLGRLAGATMGGWIAGSFLGGWLSGFGQQVPAFVAVAVYIVDIAFVLAFIPKGVGRNGPGAAKTPIAAGQYSHSNKHSEGDPGNVIMRHSHGQQPDPERLFVLPSDDDEDDDDEDEGAGEGAGEGDVTDTAAGGDKAPSPPPPSSTTAPKAKVKAPLRQRVAQYLSAIAQAFGNPKVSRVCCLYLAFNLIEGALRATMDLYLQDRFGVNVQRLAWLRTLRGVLVLATQLFAVAALVRRVGEVTALHAVVWLSIAASALEATPLSVTMYAAMVVPLQTVAMTVSRTCLGAMYTGAVPPGRRGAMLGALDVLSSVVGVVAPMLGGQVLQRAGAERQPIVAAIMYVALAIMMAAVWPAPWRRGERGGGGGGQGGGHEHRE